MTLVEGETRLKIFGGLTYSSIVIAGLLAFLPFAALAQGTTVSSVEEESVEKSKSPFSAAVTATYLVNTVPVRQRGNSQATIFSLDSRYALTGMGTAGAALTVSEDVLTPDTPKMENTRMFYISPQMSLTDAIDFEQRLGLWLPTKTDVYETESYTGGIDIEPNFKFDFLLAGQKMSGYFRPRFLKNFHRYTQSAAGAFNTEYVLRASTYLSVPVTERVSLGLLGQLQTASNYVGNWKESFRLSEMISVGLLENLFLTLGHDNSASRYEADGVTSNFAVFDREQSVYFLDVNYAL